MLAISFVGAAVGFLFGYALEGFLLGLVLGAGCVVMGESSMDTGAYKYPDRFF